MKKAQSAWIVSSVIASIGLVVLQAVAQKSGTASPAGASSPEGVVRSFVAALNRYDARRAAAYVIGAVPVSAQAPWGAAMMEDLRKEKVVFTISNLKTSIQGANATVTLKLMFSAQNPSVPPFTSMEQLPLRRGTNGWKIVPGGAKEFLQEDQKNVLRQITARLLEPKSFGPALKTAQARSCMSNLKQLSLGLLQLVTDHDDKFALKSSSFYKNVLPYTKSGAIFICPADERLIKQRAGREKQRKDDEPMIRYDSESSYAFNEQLEGVSVATVKDPAHVVMLYEGKNEVLDYRHHGRAHVAFADGEVRLVSRQEAKTLRWE